jgi:hypothetical protein
MAKDGIWVPAMTAATGGAFTVAGAAGAIKDCAAGGNCRRIIGEWIAGGIRFCLCCRISNAQK